MVHVTVLLFENGPGGDTEVLADTKYDEDPAAFERLVLDKVRVPQTNRPPEKTGTNVASAGNPPMNSPSSLRSAIASAFSAPILIGGDAALTRKLSRARKLIQARAGK